MRVFALHTQRVGPKYLYGLFFFFIFISLLHSVEDHAGVKRWSTFPFFCAFSFLILFVVFGIHIVFPSPHPSRVCVCLCWYPQSILRWSGIHNFISCISCEKSNTHALYFFPFLVFKFSIHGTPDCSYERSPIHHWAHLHFKNKVTCVYVWAVYCSLNVVNSECTCKVRLYHHIISLLLHLPIPMCSPDDWISMFPSSSLSILFGGCFVERYFAVFIRTNFIYIHINIFAEKNKQKNKK